MTKSVENRIYLKKQLFRFSNYKSTDAAVTCKKRDEDNMVIRMEMVVVESGRESDDDGAAPLPTITPMLSPFPPESKIVPPPLSLSFPAAVHLPSLLLLQAHTITLIINDKASRCVCVFSKYSFTTKKRLGRRKRGF